MRCPKCSGCLYTNYDGDKNCINCGWVLLAPVTEPIKSEQMRLQSILCSKCHTLTAIRGRELCRPCWDGKQVKLTKQCLDCKALTGGYSVYCKDCKRQERKAAR